MLIEVYGNQKVSKRAPSAGLQRAKTTLELAAVLEGGASAHSLTVPRTIVEDVSTDVERYKQEALMFKRRAERLAHKLSRVEKVLFVLVAVVERPPCPLLLHPLLFYGGF
jgi:hypothetical protein